MPYEQKIATAFKSTTNSYKYYWWYAILLSLKEGNKSTITFEEIAIHMLSLVWYPVNYYKISLGKQDQLSRYVVDIKNHYSLPDDITEGELRTFLLTNKKDDFLVRIFSDLTRYVPFRFIRPWFSGMVGLNDGLINTLIIEKQNDLLEKPPYFIDHAKRLIRINDDWGCWIVENLRLLMSFTLYELFRYVEKNNPNISNISVKLFKPQSRNLALPTRLWSEYIQNSTGAFSVFERKAFNDFNSFAIDHFLPWSFLTHDQLWNLHPAEQSSNSSKGNKLPHRDYMDGFCSLQHDFMKFLVRVDEKHVVDYNTFLMVDTIDLIAMPEEFFAGAMKNKFSPMLQTARNMRFEPDWKI